MNILQAIFLGVVEGVTEFLTVSSTVHLTIVEKLMGLPLDDAGGDGIHGDHPDRGHRRGHRVFLA